MNDLQQQKNENEILSLLDSMGIVEAISSKQNGEHICSKEVPNRRIFMK